MAAALSQDCQHKLTIHHQLCSWKHIDCILGYWCTKQKFPFPCIGTCVVRMTHLKTFGNVSTYSFFVQVYVLKLQIGFNGIRHHNNDKVVSLIIVYQNSIFFIHHFLLWNQFHIWQQSLMHYGHYYNLLLLLSKRTLSNAILYIKLKKTLNLEALRWYFLCQY